MKKTLCAILLLALLCTLVGCGQDNYGYPLWLPTEGNYLKRGTRSFVCTVSNGEVVKSEIAFSDGGRHLRAVWRTGEESLFPGVPYIIFPGNVGNEETLREIVETLTN